MEFIVFRSELGTLKKAGRRGKKLVLKVSTSVGRLKEHYFRTLRELGKITIVEDNIDLKLLARMASKPGVIMAIMHKYLPWFEFPHRVLRHTLGDFLLPQAAFNEGKYAPNTINLVTSEIQAQRIKKHLKQATPKLYVFSPSMDDKNFYPAAKEEKAKARKTVKLNDSDFHIIYAGRWLSSKGLCQLVRTLNIWPLSDVKITLVGNFEAGFHFYQNSASHFNFEHYFNREVISRNRIPLKLLRAQGPAGLRKRLWSADLFVYASIHEDENFGMAPREAVLCGLPVVTTDFCGLKTVGDSMPWGSIATYATLAGPRFSLFELRQKIESVLHCCKYSMSKPIQAVKAECDYRLAKGNLKKACEELVREPLQVVPSFAQMEKNIIKKVFLHTDDAIAKAFLNKDNSPLPEGLFAEGGAPWADQGNACLLQAAMQGIYSSRPNPPKVKTHQVWRGFFRIVAFQDERMIVEFGFPGPRTKHYSEKEWESFSMAFIEGNGEITISPQTDEQVVHTQELVDLGYLVPDFLWSFEAD